MMIQGESLLTPLAMPWRKVELTAAGCYLSDMDAAQPSPPPTHAPNQVSDESIDDGRCITYLDGLVEMLRDLVPAALKRWDADAIHDARVATRRLRAAMTLLEPALSPAHRDTFTKALRRLRRSLGPLRDADVMLEHLDEMSKLKRHAAAMRWTAEQVQRQREKFRRKCSRKADVGSILVKLGTWWGLHEELKDADAIARPLLAAAVPKHMGVFAGRADALAKVGTGPSTATPADGDDPHALRIAGKALRYSLELAQVVEYSIPAAAFSWFKRMQDALGLWHDYLVLSQTTVSLAIELEVPAHDHTLYGHLLDFSKLAWNRSQQQLRRFVTLWEDGRQHMLDSINQAFLTTADHAAPMSDGIARPETDGPIAPTDDANETGPLPLPGGS